MLLQLSCLTNMRHAFGHVTVSRVAFEEEDGLGAVLGGRRDPVHRVCHVRGETRGEIREPERDVRDPKGRVVGDDRGHRPLWGEQDDNHALGERRECVVEDLGPGVVMLENVA
jgi:hypothetical protein